MLNAWHTGLMIEIINFFLYKYKACPNMHPKEVANHNVSKFQKILRDTY